MSREPAPQCPTPNLRTGSSCKRRGCPVCGVRWARDWRKSMTENLAALHGPIVMISITAPGEERLPWDTHHCAHRRQHQHRGPAGCRVQQRAAREWADTCVYRWQKLRQAAAVATRRATLLMADGGLAPIILERVWEPQKRGVPHLHIVLPYRTYHEQMAAHCFANELAQRAHEYDFGFVDARADSRQPYGRRLKVTVAEDCAKYLSSYLTGRSTKKNSIRENISDPVMPRSLIWQSPKMTSTGAVTANGRPTWVTMRTLRRARQLYAWARGVCPAPIWQDMFEAARVALVCRKVFSRKDVDGDDPPDVDQVMAFAGDLQHQLGGPKRWRHKCYKLPDWYSGISSPTSVGEQINEFWAGVAGVRGLAAA